MFHPSRKGIYCDFCSDEVLISNGNKSITYYLMNVKKAVVTENMPHDIKDTLDMDICEKCHERFKERVLEVANVNNKKRESHGTKRI